jgi:hypothetical protein
MAHVPERRRGRSDEDLREERRNDQRDWDRLGQTTPLSTTVDEQIPDGADQSERSAKRRGRTKRR